MGFLDPNSWSQATKGDPGGMSWEQMLMRAQQIEEQKRLQDQARADTAPYRQVGETGAGMLNAYLLGGYNPNNDPNYGFAKQELGTNTGRQLRAMGRENSSYGMGALGKAYGNLALQTQDNWWNKLMGATNVGQGTAATSNGMLNNASQNSSNMYTQMMDQMNTNAFNNQQNSYNKAAVSGNMGNDLMNTYRIGQNAGWWGGGGSGANSGGNQGLSQVGDGLWSYNDASQVGPPSSAANSWWSNWFSS